MINIVMPHGPFTFETFRKIGNEMNYAIDDGDGNRLTTGLQEHNAEKVAQRMADDLGQPVYLYPIGEDEADAEIVEVRPHEAKCATNNRSIHVQ